MKIKTCLGLTLVEIMLAVAIFTGMCAGLVGALLAGRSAWTVNENSSNVQHQARNVLSVMVKDLRQANGLKTVEDQQSTHIYFKHPTDGNVSYVWDKTTKQVTRTAKGQTAVVASSVSNLSVQSASATSTASTTTDVGQTAAVTSSVSHHSAQSGSATSAASTTTDAGQTAAVASPVSNHSGQSGSAASTASTASTTTDVGQTATIEVTVTSTSDTNQTDTVSLTDKVVSSNTGSTGGSGNQGGSTPPAPVGSTVPATQNSYSTHGFTIPIAHPRLWWNADRLAKAQAWLAAHPFTPNSDDYFSIAWKHAVANTDCSTAITWALNFEIPTGEYSPSANGSDYARWSGETAFIIYDWCYDELTTQQKSDFLNNIAGSGKGWNDYLAGINQQGWGSPSMVDSNYNWGNLRNDIEYGIATYTENTTFAETVLDDGINTRWTQYFVPASSLPKIVGGVPGEGDAYGTSLASYALIPFLSMELLGRDIFSESGYYKQFIYYVIYATAPAPTPSAYYVQPYGDDEQFVDGGMLQIRNYYQDIMNFFSNYYSTINVGKDARQWVNTVGVDANTKVTSKWILAQDLNPSARATSNLPLDYYASGIQYLYGRKAWDTSSAYFFWQMGSATMHSHSDVGNFHIWRGGRWLTRETTGYSNTIAGYGYRVLGITVNSSPLGHNTIVFGTPLYTDDIGLMPSVPEGNSVVNRLESATGYSYADVDMTNQYLWSSGYSYYNRGAVVHVERELLFLRDLETTVVFDRITAGNVIHGPDTGLSAANQVNTFNIHFEVAPTIYDKNHIEAINVDQSLYMTTLVPAVLADERVINEQSCSGCSSGIGQYRVELDTSGAAQRYFLNVLQAMNAGGNKITASVVDSTPADPTTGTFTVTLHPVTGSNTVIVFNKGQTSTGGTVSLAGAKASNLRTGVQTISYTDNGPVWLAATCGDGSCSGGETCTSCAADCGPCP